MKKNTLIFLSVILCALLVAPIVNLVSAPHLDKKNWRKKSFLYNMDFASSALSLALYPMGISTDPKQVVIGREGWLYLGDNHEQVISVARRGKTAADVVIEKKIDAATQAWDRWLTSKGVRLFRVMIGPNKETIYPEYLPSWVKNQKGFADPIYTGISNSRADNFVDLRVPLLAAKASTSTALYYHNDTHWNSFGAGIAFHAFANEVGRSAPELKWLTKDSLSLGGEVTRNGGDLADFLRISKHLHDSDPYLKAIFLPVKTTQSDFDTGEVVYKGGNSIIISSFKPLLVKSTGAVNDKKVLWIRDSFGTALAPLMAATFSQTLQLHWDPALKPGGRFVELVEKWKPDYVFMTVVERSSRSEVFANYPPN